PADRLPPAPRPGYVLRRSRCIDGTRTEDPDVYDHQALVRLLASRAYREGEFVLSSGRKSNFYLDAKQVTYDPVGIRLVGEAVYELIMPFGVQAVGGLTMGADAIAARVAFLPGGRGTPNPGLIVRTEPKQHGPQQALQGGLTMGADAIVASVAFLSGERGTPIPGFIVRKEPKQHGLQKAIEGVFPPGARCAIVEDTLTTGASALRAVQAVRDAGGEVAVVV